MAISSVETLLEQLESLSKSPPQDKVLQQRLYDAAKKLSSAVEAPLDTVYRVIYSPMLLSVAQTGSYMKIFSTLVEKGGPCTIDELAEPSEADVVFTARILRFLASHGLIAQKSGEVFESNRLTEALCHDGHRAGMNHMFHIHAGGVLEAPEFFKATKYQNPESMTNTPFQIAHNTDLPAFLWAHLNRDDLTAEFGLWMTAMRGQRTWLDVINFEALLSGTSTDAETPVFVDVGGGIGSQCALFKARLPDLPGRVILQDLPNVIEHALVTEGVENTGHDFWVEQPVKGARAYYLRTIFHDYPDSKCLAILKNTMDAMGPESVILIDDIIMPDVGMHSRSTEMDFLMMTTLASMERTAKQWDNLLAAAGLELLQRVTYLEDTAESIQVLVPKGRKST